MDKQSRKYQLTINNPQEHGLDHDSIKRLLELFKSRAYWCMADEIGLETGTPHTHIFLMLNSPAKFSTVKKRLPMAHIETAHGTVQENRDYIQKSGKWAEDKKSDTSVPGTFEEWGDPDEPGQGYRSDLAEIEALLASSATPAEILAENFAYRRYKSMIRDAYFDKRKRETPTKRDVKIHYKYLQRRITTMENKTITTTPNAEAKAPANIAATATVPATAPVSAATTTTMAPASGKPASGLPENYCSGGSLTDAEGIILPEYIGETAEALAKALRPLTASAFNTAFLKTCKDLRKKKVLYTAQKNAVLGMKTQAAKLVYRKRDPAPAVLVEMITTATVKDPATFEALYMHLDAVYSYLLMD